MSLTDRKLGKDAKLFWIDSTGTVEISGDRRSADITREVMTQNMEAGNDTAAAQKATLYHYAAEMTAFYIGTAGTAVANRLKEGSEGTLIYGPLGTAAGLPKGGFPALVVGAPMSIPFPDGIEITVTWEGQGALSFDDRSAVWP